ncbi:MAG: glycosyltransferase family 2 protein, partial [Candidatus Brocadiales bacterium]|nr:glycosyltransferase family 2 protein [Candidatus Brocadiales bacterium]
MAINNNKKICEIRIPPKVTIITLHLKNIPCLVDCIKSLNMITYRNYNIMVVHNGPENIALKNSLSPISQHIAKIINTGENLGFARGNNIGIRQALKDGAEYILLLNDDTEVAPDFLTTLIDVAELRPDAGMLGSTIFYYDQPQKIWFAGARFDRKSCIVTTTEFDQFDKSKSSALIESDYITGCALLIRRDAIEKIGLLDERFFLYCEDVDWGLRCIKAGLKNLIIPGSHIWHKISISSGGIDSLMRAYHKTRSQLLIVRLYKPKILCKLQRKFFRDIAWVLFKSSDPHRIKKARAFLAAMIDYHT